MPRVLFCPIDNAVNKQTFSKSFGKVSLTYAGKCTLKYQDRFLLNFCSYNGSIGMPKLISYSVVCILLYQIIISWLRYPNSVYHILIILPLLIIIGCIFYRDFLMNPLKRCPLCKRWLKINDYEFIANDGIEIVVLCKKCKRQYRIKK